MKDEGKKKLSKILEENNGMIPEGKTPLADDELDGVAGGYTMYKSDEDKSYISKTEMDNLAQLAEETEKLLNAYCAGILSNSGIKENLEEI